MFREEIVGVYNNRLSEAPSRTPQQSWVESRLDRILQKRRDMSPCVMLCHVASCCVAPCASIAPASHEPRTSQTTCLWAKQITMCMMCVLPHLDWTTATYCNLSSTCIRKCSDPLWHVATACDNATTLLDRARTLPGLEMSEETLNYGDKACLKLCRYVMIRHDTLWYVMIRHDTSWYVMIRHYENLQDDDFS